jgi:hypothetical protein
MTNITVYTPEEKLYLLLELRKVYENHSTIPTLFLYPNTKFTFDGICFLESVTRFQMTKNSIHDTWKIRLQNENDFVDYNNTCAYDSLQQLFHHRKNLL